MTTVFLSFSNSLTYILTILSIVIQTENEKFQFNSDSNINSISSNRYNHKYSVWTTSRYFVLSRKFRKCYSSIERP